MIHIPREEIKQPSVHADSLGFTFVWQGHFLRGIFPEAVESAMNYFDTGFLDDVVGKDLFPKTWVSEFESEQFGMILEHEMIQPVLFATEWNSSMLKDAALMVLEIAEIGWRFGFNMVDCHKKNVMFKNNKPLYVDLGSFVPREKGCTGWKPYKNFLESYTYILDMWTHGCPQLAKRMMAPGVTIQTNDYLAWKRPLYRHFPCLLSIHTKSSKVNNDIAILGGDKLKGIRGFAKRLSSLIKPAVSQRFKRLCRGVNGFEVDYSIEKKSDQQFDLCLIDQIDAITCINLPNVQIVKDLQQRAIRSIISLHEMDCISNSEYRQIKNITSVSYQIMGGGVIIRDNLPESRLQSDCVLAYCGNSGNGRFVLHNNIVYLEYCMSYSSTGTMYVLLPQANERMLDLLRDRWTVNRISEDGTMIEVTQSH